MLARSAICALAATLALLCDPASVAAQRHAAYLVRVRDSTRAAQQVYRPTYWVEGATVGAAIVGTTGAWIAYEFRCEFSENPPDCAVGPILATGVLGALLGGTVGGLIGGAFPAAKTRPLQGHPVRSTAIGTAAGALWSFGLFWQFCLNGCRSDEVAFGLSTTAVGALAGLLVGR